MIYDRDTTKMGNSNSSSVIKNYIDNNTELSAKIDTHINIGATASSDNRQGNVVNFSVGGLNCCKDLSITVKTAGESDASYKIRADAALAAHRDCLLVASNAVIKCNLDLVQVNTGDVRISQEVNAVVNQELINVITQVANDQIKSLIKQRNDADPVQFGSQGNNSDIETTIINSVKVDLSNSLSIDVQSNLRNVSGQNNTDNISICAGTLEGKECNVNQSSSITAYSKNISGTAATTISRNDEVIKFASTLNSDVAQTNTNWLSDLIGELGTAEKIIIAVIIACIMIALLVGVAFVMIYLFKKRR